MSPDEIALIKRSESRPSSCIHRLPILQPPLHASTEQRFFAPYTVSAATGPDSETMDASLLMSSEYIQPLMPSELPHVVNQIFDPEVAAYLRHMAARKLVSWHQNHPVAMFEPSISNTSAPDQSDIASPSVLSTSLQHSGILLRPGSELSLNTSNSFALARVADHTQREEHLAQVRLSKWATDLQISLQRERERYQRLAKDNRANWLVERMGEEIRDGKVVSLESAESIGELGPQHRWTRDIAYSKHDPLGLLQWQNAVKTRGWIALQVVGSLGVVGGLAYYVSRAFGFSIALNTWVQEWTVNWYGMND